MLLLRGCTTMITIPLTTEDLTKVRLSPSPSGAHQLQLSPAAVSVHLSRLKAAELVELQRIGKRVYYPLSGAGESLLGIVGELE